MLESAQRTLGTVTAHPEIFLDLASDEELSPESKVRIHTQLTRVMRAREFEWLQYQNGLLDKAAWRSYDSIIPLLLTTGAPTAGGDKWDTWDTTPRSSNSRMTWSQANLILDTSTRLLRGNSGLLTPPPQPPLTPLSTHRRGSFWRGTLGSRGRP